MFILDPAVLLLTVLAALSKHVNYFNVQRYNAMKCRGFVYQPVRLPAT